MRNKEFIPYDDDIDIPPEPAEFIVLLPTFKGEAWQNMVIYGYKQTINSAGQTIRRSDL